MRYLPLVLAAALAACTTTQAPLTLKVPVAVPCLGEMPARPVREFGASTGKTYPGHTEAVRAAEREWSRWEQYANDIEAATAGCLSITAKKGTP